MNPIPLDHWGVTGLSFSPDCKILASFSSDFSVKIWNFKTKEIIHSINGHDGHITAASFSTDGRKFATASQDHTIKIWDIHNEDKKPVVLMCDGFVPRTIRFSDDGNFLFSNGEDSSILHWDLNMRTIKKSFDGHHAGVTSLDISPNTDILISSSQDANRSSVGSQF